MGFDTIPLILSQMAVAKTKVSQAARDIIRIGNQQNAIRDPRLGREAEVAQLENDKNKAVEDKNFWEQFLDLVKSFTQPLYDQGKLVVEHARMKVTA